MVRLLGRNLERRKHRRLLRSYLGKKTDDEIDAAVKAHNKAFFAPKVPEIPYVKTLDPVKVARTVDNLYDPVPSPPSDYRRSISRSFDKTMEQANKGKQIPQLGEQEGQSVPPLKVFDDKAAKAGSLQHIDWNTVLPFAGGILICSRGNFGR